VTRLPLTYVLPLRRDEGGDVGELAAYVRGLAASVETIVADGSPPKVFAAQGEAFGPDVVHVRPDPQYHFANGKVDGVMTGLRMAAHEGVVVADDDVRWDVSALARAARLLEDHDVVRPQNYFDPRPWHARWDTARSLLNRAFAADYPGTLAVRRRAVLAAGGYDGDAMFENLELIRTVLAAGGTVCSPLDLYVRRIPPTTRQFVGQRVRQAYDDFAQPPRLAAELSLLPLAIAAASGRRWGALAKAAGLAVGLAEVGRRRAGGAEVFPPSCSLYAPLWVGERAVCVWLALGSRLAWGGIRYRGRVLPLAATPTRELRRRVAAVQGAA
jgi:Glycosyltransferase like family 2